MTLQWTKPAGAPQPFGFGAAGVATELWRSAAVSPVPLEAVPYTILHAEEPIGEVEGELEPVAGFAHARFAALPAFERLRPVFDRLDAAMALATRRVADARASATPPDAAAGGRATGAPPGMTGFLLPAGLLSAAEREEVEAALGAARALAAGVRLRDGAGADVKASFVAIQTRPASAPRPTPEQWVTVGF